MPVKPYRAEFFSHLFTDSQFHRRWIYWAGIGLMGAEDNIWLEVGREAGGADKVQYNPLRD